MTLGADISGPLRPAAPAAESVRRNSETETCRKVSVLTPKIDFL